MEILRYDFRKDLLIWLIVVVLIGTLLASAVGYIADNYFGDTVNNLVGDYGEYDFLLSINQEVEESAVEEIEKIMSTKLPDSELISGVNVAGQANYFLKIDSNFRNQEIFEKVNDLYFEQIIGLDNISVIAEPMLSVRGMVGDSNLILGEQLEELKQVEFILPSSSGLDIIFRQESDLEQAEAAVLEILSEHQLLQLKLPLEEDLSGLALALAEQLEAELGQENLSKLKTEEFDDLGALVKTMTEMRNFLLGYATIVEVEVGPDFEVEMGEKLAMGSKDDNSLAIFLSPLTIEDGTLSALISQGDVGELGAKEVYQLDEQGRVNHKLGVAEVKKPRYLLQQAVNETKNLLPDLDALLYQFQSLNKQLLPLLLEEQHSLENLEELGTKLNFYQEQLSSLELDSASSEQINKLLDKVIKLGAELEDNLIKFSYLQDRLWTFRADLDQFELELVEQIEFFTLLSNDSHSLSDSLSNLNLKVREETESIITELKRYDSYLEQVQNWRNQLEQWQYLLAQGSELDLALELETILNQSARISEGLQKLELVNLEERFKALEQSLLVVSDLDLDLLIQELDNLELALPQLRDEEITGSIQLLDQHLSGEVVPGEMLYYLVAADVEEKLIQQVITENFAEQEFSLTLSEAGLVRPNVRGELFKVLSEVRTIITALTALIFTAFALFVDQSLLMVSIKRINSEQNNGLMKFLASSYVYGFLIGGILLMLIFWLSGAGLPYLNLMHIGILGALLGLLAARKAEAINPIDESDFLAGEAMGLDYTLIMYELIIPRARPGFLSLLNRRRMVFE